MAIFNPAFLGDNLDSRFDATACMSCGLCTGTCPMEIGVLPRQLFRHAMLGLEELSEHDRATVARARRLERFLTQPFFSTEQFTGAGGRLVRLKDTIEGCERILADEFTSVPEDGLYMIGSVDEIAAAEEETVQ